MDEGKVSHSEFQQINAEGIIELEKVIIFQVLMK